MDLAGYLAVLRRRLVAVVLCVAAGVAGGLGLAFSGHPTYQATARTLVDMPAATQLQDALAGAQLSEQLLGTYAQVAGSASVARRAATLAGLNVADVRGALSAKVEPQTFLIDVTAMSSSPQKAQRIANAGVQALSEQVAFFERNRPQPVSVQMLDPAGLPQVPVSPRKKLDVVLGILLGLVAGLALAALLEALDKTIKGAGQAARATRSTLLATIPLFGGRRVVVVSRDGPSSAVEAFRALRTAIQFSRSGAAPRQLLVTSPSASDGKTTVAANLAAAIALGGSTVVLIDADMRDGIVAKSFGLGRGPGLSAVLAGTVDLDEAMVEVHDNLWVLPAGDVVPNPAELLGSQAMTDLLDRLSDVDMVIVDVPAVLPVTDAVVTAAHVDACVLVVRHRRTQASAAAEARRRLDAVGAHVVGFVLNAVPRNTDHEYPTESVEPVPAQPGAPAAASEPVRIGG